MGLILTVCVFLGYFVQKKRLPFSMEIRKSTTWGVLYFALKFAFMFYLAFTKQFSKLV